MNAIVAAVMAVCAVLRPQLPDAAGRLVRYDATLPLNATYQSLQTTADAEVSRLEYDSPQGGRVTGFLVVPRRLGRRAGIVFGHWGEGNATEFLPEAIRYANAGAVSILIDDPWMRPRPWFRPRFEAAAPAEQDLAVMAQAVVDLRRAFDLLVSRSDVDPSRLAYVGHSVGAQFGAVLAAVDQRMKTAVLIAGHPSLETTWFETNDPEMIEQRKTIGEDALKREFEVVGALDGIRFVPYAAPVSLLFQFGKYDHIPAARLQAYADAASQPKAVKWYPAGHSVNDPAALYDRALWLERNLGLKGAASAMRR